MKDRLKQDAQFQKIIDHLMLFGKFKNFNEVEGSNQRINDKIKELTEEGLLKRDQEGYYDLNYEEHPELKQAKEFWIEAKTFLEATNKINLDDQRTKEVIKELNVSQKVIDEIYEKSKKLTEKLK